MRQFWLYSSRQRDPCQWPGDTPNWNRKINPVLDLGGPCTRGVRINFLASRFSHTVRILYVSAGLLQMREHSSCFFIDRGSRSVLVLNYTVGCLLLDTFGCNWQPVFEFHSPFKRNFVNGAVCGWSLTKYVRYESNLERSIVSDSQIFVSLIWLNSEILERGGYAKHFST